MSRSLVVLAVLAASAGCSVMLRSPDEYRDATKQVLESKNAEIKACYDELLKTNATVQGKVTVKFDVEEKTGKIGNVVVDPGQSTAPEPLQTCVRKALDGLALAQPDDRKGEGTWVYEFAAQAPGAPPPAAPAPAPAAPGKT